MEERDIALVTRFIRPDQSDWLTDLKYPQNLHGITIRYVLDYDSQTVTASWAICNGDNFDKFSGIVGATVAPRFSFDLEDVATYRGLTNALRVNLSSRFGEYVMPNNCDCDYELDQRLFLKAKRKLAQGKRVHTDI